MCISRGVKIYLDGSLIPYFLLLSPFSSPPPPKKRKQARTKLFPSARMSKRKRYAVVGGGRGSRRWWWWQQLVNSKWLCMLTPTGERNDSLAGGDWWYKIKWRKWFHIWVSISEMRFAPRAKPTLVIYIKKKAERGEQANYQRMESDWISLSQKLWLYGVYRRKTSQALSIWHTFCLMFETLHRHLYF